MLHSAPMLISIIRRRLIALLLLAGLLLQSVLPALAGAAADTSARWVEVCAASGVKWIKPDSDVGSGHQGSADHCVLCLATGAVPDFDVRAYLGEPVADATPVHTTTAVFPAYPGHDLRSRAPPRFS